jgi:hypothetical protein
MLFPATKPSGSFIPIGDIGELLRTPGELGWSRGVDLHGRSFLRRDALLTQAADGGPRRFAGAVGNTEEPHPVLGTGGRRGGPDVDVAAVAPSPVQDSLRGWTEGCQAVQIPAAVPAGRLRGRCDPLVSAATCAGGAGVPSDTTIVVFSWGGLPSDSRPGGRRWGGAADDARGFRCLLVPPTSLIVTTAAPMRNGRTGMPPIHRTYGEPPMSTY